MRAISNPESVAPKGPVARREELVIDQVADHLQLAAAQKIRRHKISD